MKCVTLEDLIIENPIHSVANVGSNLDISQSL